MDPFFLWLEATPLSVWIRESTLIVAFPGILSMHAIGMGLAAGINGAMALHHLGVAAAIPRGELNRFLPAMWLGFWLNLVSGILLLIAYPTKALTNPVFYLKITFIVAAMMLAGVIRRSDPRDGSGRWLGAAALVCWAGAITSGRLLAYTYSRLSASW